MINECSAMLKYKLGYREHSHNTGRLQTSYFLFMIQASETKEHSAARLTVGTNQK